MKILIATNMAPFVWGGAEELAVHLRRNLVVAGHQAEILRIPFSWEPAVRLPSQMMMVRAFELRNVDKVIALKFPAYLIRHPNKTFWLLHQYRQAYDLFEAGDSNLPSNDTGRNLRSIIRNADNESFRDSRLIYTNSEITKQRLLKYNGIEGRVLLPPVNDPELFEGASVGDYIFSGGRINNLKRQYLLLEALALAHKGVKLVIAGPPDAPEDEAKLKKLVLELGLQGRVRLDLRLLLREEYAQYMRGCAAAAYIPFDEDSLGYVAMEAATAGKAIITTNDSGGILGLAKEGVTGWVAKPSASSLAEAMCQALEDSNRLAQYGKAARDLLSSMKINWSNTLRELLK